MNRRPLRALVPVAMLTLVGMTGACSSDDDPVDPPASTDLSGAYELVSVTQAGVTLGPAQGATGTLTLTQTTYVIDLTIPDQTGTPVNTVDNGTYTTSGNTWTQESSNTGLQGVGTFTLQGGTLTIDATVAGVQVLSVWSDTA